MKKIYLFCSAGMSTSMLASSMQSEADKRNLTIEVVAYPLNPMSDIIYFNRPDCILLGPQSKYMYDEVVTQYGELGIPIAVIDTEAYGMMNGEKVLTTAILMIKNKGSKVNLKDSK